MPAFLIRWLSMAFNGLRLRSSPQKHRLNVKKSRKLLARLAELGGEAQALAYLRKVDPYLFEEVALSLLERRGVFVLRSKSYSGDGGADGAFYWPGRGLHAVQCKRYGKAITPAHARAFADLCGKQFKGGLFVHTGRTGDSSQEALAAPGLGILSGSDLARCARDPSCDPLDLIQRRKDRAQRR